MEKKYTISLHISESELESLAQFYFNQALIHGKNNDKVSELRCVTNATMLRMEMPEEMKASFDSNVQSVKDFIKRHHHTVHDMRSVQYRTLAKRLITQHLYNGRTAHCPHCSKETDQILIPLEPGNPASAKAWQCMECNNFASTIDQL